MDWIIEPERRTPVISEVGLLVCGGGFAGVAAAVAAARNGAKVLLVERYGFLGGLVTGSLVITTPPLDNGINLEIRERLNRWGAYLACRHSGTEVAAQKLHAIEPEVIKYELTNMLKEAGVEILLHSYICGVVMDGWRIAGVIMENKGGRQAVRADIIVDTTGDADIASLAGSPLRLLRKPMTMMFNMVGVDTAKALATLGDWGKLRNMVKDAMDKGQLAYDLGIVMNFEAPGVYAEELIHEGELNVWSGNLMDMNGVDVRDLTDAETITREHVMRLASFLKNSVPGFEKSRIEYTATQVGVRATRQIIGEASPSDKEVKGGRSEDTVVKPYAKGSHRLPYGSLLPQKVDNLLVAGRCISAEDDAISYLRLIPVCSATGQAAGTAGALALKLGVKPKELDIPALQKALHEQKMIL